MPEVPNDPTYEDKQIDLSETRKSADLFDVEPAQPFDGQIMSLMSPYEPAPDSSPPPAAPAASAGDE